MGYKKKRQFQRDFFIIYGIWGCIEVIGLLTGIGQELLNDFAKLGVEAILYMLEDVPFILIYLSFGFAFLIGELIAWILHIGREFEKKIIEKRNAGTQGGRVLLVLLFRLFLMKSEYVNIKVYNKTKIRIKVEL